MSENPHIEDAEVTFEICPVCSQRTASHLFRKYKKSRLCFLCAQRAEQTEQEEHAYVLDRRVHGGLVSNVMRHLLWVAVFTILSVFGRGILVHFLVK